MSDNIQYVEDVKHFLVLSGSLCYTDCLFLLEDIKKDLELLTELPENSNYFLWKLDEIFYKVCNIQQRLPYDDEKDMDLYD